MTGSPRPSLRTVVAAAATCAAWALGAVSGPPALAAEPKAELAEVGRRIFLDGSLSEPRGTSCGSCHEPARAYSGDHGSGAGVPAGSRPGAFARRSTPSLFYLSYVPRFRFFSEDADNHALDLEPYGGFFWDGRADSIAALVRQPLLNPREMNNRDLAQIADKLRRAGYASDFARVFPGALDAPEGAVGALGVALEAFLTSPAMAPFSSKFDDYVRARATLTPQERQGLMLFSDRRRGGCTKCHTMVDAPSSPEQSLFTDFGYEAVGAPRNRRMRPEEDRGLCERTDTLNPTNETRYCASFRTPSLRNVALRPSFMHNGAFTRLRDVVAFYATRATAPGRWYPGAHPFDDTPAPYRGLIDTASVPYNRHPGDPPAFAEAEIDALVAFLETLTDQRR